ncbi:MAG: hypothetical protein C6W56_01160 [Caldibacillus debilis]|nr:hypothetical protein [Bacillaceae bacterium]REJ30960.1 MAG: hypothetical protein C6W56_01160 [Caldibacillus debilis]
MKNGAAEKDLLGRARRTLVRKKRGAGETGTFPHAGSRLYSPFPFLYAGETGIPPHGTAVFLSRARPSPGKPAIEREIGGIGEC